MNLVRTITSAAVLLISLGFFAASSYAHDLVWPGEKLKTLFPQAVSFEQKNLYVSDEQKVSIEKALGSKLPEEDMKPSIYFAVIKTNAESPPRKAAAILFVDAVGDNGKIEIGLVVSGKGELMKIQIFENNESLKITRQDFLKQFEGKKATDQLKVGSDITAPVGTDKSAQAIAAAARRGLLIINEMFRKK
ncbi:MAG: hypothetical protein Q8K68_08200 [Nitrospirota bacterium]|nr:hypothetical protein [Nitrospirota bacterium]